MQKTPSQAFKEQIEGQIDAFGPVIFAALIAEDGRLCGPCVTP